MVRAGPTLSVVRIIKFPVFSLGRDIANESGFPNLDFRFQSSFSICYTASRARNLKLPLHVLLFLQSNFLCLAKTSVPPLKIETIVRGTLCPPCKRRRVYMIHERQWDGVRLMNQSFI